MSVSIPAPLPPTQAAPARRSRVVVWGIALYIALALAALLSGRAWLGGLAAFVLVGVILLPRLRRPSVSAWLLWLGLAVLLVALARHGEGHLALDAMPALVNALLSAFFARSLASGREPLIARLIAIIEGPQRLADRGVAAYARGLTLAWALLLGAQALLLALLAAAAPGGLFTLVGLESPLAGSGWRWYAHLGSYALVAAFLLLEYAWRRWHLRHIPHLSLVQFLGRLVQRWPALLMHLVAETPRKTP
jgi:uncharacterized membrane protein